MARRPGSTREIDLQTLKQAGACIGRAIELFVRNQGLDDVEVLAQVQLAWRFIDEYVDKRTPVPRKRFLPKHQRKSHDAIP